MIFSTSEKLNAELVLIIYKMLSKLKKVEREPEVLKTDKEENE